MSTDNAWLRRLREKAFGRWDPPWPNARDEAAWQAMFDKAWATLKNHEARAVVDDMKRIRYMWLQEYIREESEERRLRELGWLRGWLEGRMRAAEMDHACVDNRRWAECGRSSQVRRYRKQQENGCCGRHDEVVTHWLTGRRFMIGFNYGH